MRIAAFEKKKNHLLVWMDQNVLRTVPTIVMLCEYSARLEIIGFPLGDAY